MNLFEDDAALTDGDEGGLLSTLRRRIAKQQRSTFKYAVVTQLGDAPLVTIDTLLSAEQAEHYVGNVTGLMLLQGWRVVAQTRFSALLAYDCAGGVVMDFSVEAHSHTMIAALTALEWGTKPLSAVDDSAADAK